jgi:hypothetical protein
MASKGYILQGDYGTVQFVEMNVMPSSASFTLIYFPTLTLFACFPVERLRG